MATKNSLYLLELKHRNHINFAETYRVFLKVQTLMLQLRQLRIHSYEVDISLLV